MSTPWRHCAPSREEVFVNAPSHFPHRRLSFADSMVVRVVLLSLGSAHSRARASQAITLPLSPTSLNVFNFGAHNFKVQYPPGTAFSGVFMTVTTVQMSQSAFHARVAGSQFANALCVVYPGEAGFSSTIASLARMQQNARSCARGKNPDPSRLRAASI